MKQKIITILKKFREWLKYWLWKHPVSKPIPEKPIRVMAEQVFDEYKIITYHGQRINLHINELPMWAKMSRKEKRVMAAKMGKQERKGLIRFEEINGKLICIKNKNYGEQKNIQ